ncbi:hypothetical protein BDK92_3857 [Micromonospora pisi]|uniref:Uncharacterized protein n=1 Tax=Micromonospora pisi TaxID=589240 RepID=A0A495JLH3_9ACTN|nr:hypothetical protein [Micromonospora pisi]RKR89505.1 hypothetical protein BDK92_3857 [Micromonospora pisi]
MELARLWLGLIVAVCLPMSLPFLRRNWVAAIFCAGYAAYAIFPVLDGWAAVLTWCVAMIAGQGGNLLAQRDLRRLLRRPGSRGDQRESITLIRKMGVAAQSGRTALLLAGSLMISGLTFAGGHATDVIQDLVLRDEWAVILSGFLIAVFTGNELVVLVLRPYLGALTEHGEDVSKIIPLGVYLGWVERALVFIFITAGQPEAAALAIAAKSLARLPEVHRHDGTGFGQYVTVGTLTSLLVSVATGLTVRVALGLSPL